MTSALAGAPGETAAPRYQRFRAAAWGLLAFNMLVVLWGASVRATGSGAGCGDRWPLCNGTVVPRAPRMATLIEFTHRATSGLSLVGVAGLCWWAFCLFRRGHRARLFALLSMVFLLAEALLGAGLVLFQYVEHNASAGRAVYLSAHLVNTQILLAVLAATAWFASGPLASQWRAAPKLVMVSLPVALLVAVTGALAALGDTLYPASSVAGGLRAEFSNSAVGLLRVRIVHPALALFGGVVLLLAAVRAARMGRPPAARLGAAVATLVLLELSAGALNITLLAPLWMQILHLLIADLLWIALVLMTLEAGRVHAEDRLNILNKFYSHQD